MRRSRWIFQTLILSAGLNVTLLCTFFYFLIRDNPLHFAFWPKKEIITGAPPVSSTFLGRFNSFPFSQLVELLSDTRKVQQGFRVRDFALGTLAAYHDLDVERALGRGKLSQRKWEWEVGIFIVYPGLSDQDFSALQKFVQIEKFPFTAEGLFKRLAAIGIEKSPSELIHIFCHTPEFVLLETLCARTRLPIQRKTVLSLALEAGWEHLNAFYLSQQEQVDFSKETRVAFLIGAIEKKSPTAAYLLVMTDLDYAVKDLEDDQVEKILHLLTVKTQEALRFAQIVAVSPRGDGVRDRALSCLASYNEKMDTKEESELAGHFIEKPGLKDLRPVFRQQPPAAPSPQTHIVQPGESLWQIARKYNTPMEQLIEFNHLQTHVIQPGKSLRIPP